MCKFVKKNAKIPFTNTQVEKAEVPASQKAEISLLEPRNLKHSPATEQARSSETETHQRTMINNAVMVITGDKIYEQKLLRYICRAGG